CHHPFAFEPREGDLITDVGFKNAIEAVSGQGQLRWGVENLYYEVCRRKRLRSMPFGCAGMLLLLSAALVPLAIAARKLGPFPWFAAAFLWLFGAVAVGVRLRASFVRLDREKFRLMWDRWCAVHETPPGVIVRREF